MCNHFARDKKKHAIWHLIDKLINYLLKSSQCVVLSYVSYISIDITEAALTKAVSTKAGSSRKHLNKNRHINIISFLLQESTR